MIGRSSSAAGDLGKNKDGGQAGRQKQTSHVMNSHLGGLSQGLTERRINHNLPHAEAAPQGASINKSEKPTADFAGTKSAVTSIV
jgi:hypothetical protein